jgi:hypothetical protein
MSIAMGVWGIFSKLHGLCKIKVICQLYVIYRQLFDGNFRGMQLDWEIVVRVKLHFFKAQYTEFNKPNSTFLTALFAGWLINVP